jgi:hypothetical protein
MQPCTTCGSTTVNPIGYCTGCGTFRGTETAQPGYGQQPYVQSYEQYQQPGYGEQPAQPQPAQPQYAQPQYQQPPYAQYGPAPQQPYPPQQFAPQQFPPAQPRRSNSGLVIGIVVGVLILLIGGGAAIALVLTDDDEPTKPTNPAGSTPTAASSAPADPCIIGVWVEKQSNYVFQFEGVSVNMSTSGATQRFRADGTGDLDMTAGIVATGTAGGKQYERTTNGKITFRYHPQGDRIYYTNVVGTGSSTVKVDGVAKGTPVPVSGSIDPDTYTCSGDTFVQSGDGYRIELVKQQ